MPKYLFVIMTLFLINCGGSTTADYRTALAVDASELKYKKGDCLHFKIDSLAYGAVIVFDFSKEEGDIWYGMLLTDYESTNKPTIESIVNARFLGRKIQSSLDERGFVIGIDTEYVLDILLADNFTLVGTVSLSDKVRLGSQGTTSKMENLIQKLNNGNERRLKAPDDYRDHLTKLNDFRPDEYFDVRNFLNE